MAECLCPNHKQSLALMAARVEADLAVLECTAIVNQFFMIYLRESVL